MQLSAENINTIMFDCLYSDEDLRAMNHTNDESANVPPPGSKIISGIVHRFALKPERLEAHREDVKSMLDQLPDEFKTANDAPITAGSSFLNMVTDKDGNQWGSQKMAEALYVLGSGLGYASIPIPREIWFVMPGGVPLIQIDTSK